MRYVLLCITAWVFLSACTPESSSHLVGNDKDAHGCIASAGYVWSSVRKECIRTWETGFQLSEVTDGSPNLWASGVFSNDYNQVEIFLPTPTHSPLLNRSGNEWKSPQSAWRLVRHPAHVGQQELWELFEDGTLRYQAHPVLTQPLPMDVPATSIAH